MAKEPEPGWKMRDGSEIDGFAADSTGYGSHPGLRSGIERLARRAGREHPLARAPSKSRRPWILLVIFFLMFFLLAGLLYLVRM
jgi:hypothetical protein